MAMYRNHVNLVELKDTVIKLLLRCAYGYECLERLSIIFKMQKRHSKIAASLGIIAETKKPKSRAKSRSSSKGGRYSPLKKKPLGEKASAELEAKVAYFCLHASRLYHQIKAFNMESMHTAQVHQSVRDLCAST